jgi:hypothetical protein
MKILKNNEYRDLKRCRACGGKCCLIYWNELDEGSKPTSINFKDYNIKFKDYIKDIKGWDEELKKSGTGNITPLFDPLTIHLIRNKFFKKELIAKGINPNKCKYCDENGCIIPWKLRPVNCRRYRCKEWLQKEESQNE